MTSCDPSSTHLWFYIWMTSSSLTRIGKITRNTLDRSFKPCRKLCANLEKCIFDMSQIQYLGYIIDVQGGHVDRAKIQVIRDWLALTTLTKLRSFSSLTNFYRRFVLGFSHITWPLSQVTKGEAKAKFSWSESQQKAFVELKHCLCFAPILILPYLQQPFEIKIDASDYAIGAVLTQHRHLVT